jgi:hypothetical protein
MVSGTAVQPRRVWNVIPHLIAGSVTLTYAWYVSQTKLVTTSVQFVSPLAVMILCHLLCQCLSGGYAAGFSRRVLGRSVVTAFAILIAVGIGTIVAPYPAEANAGEVFGVILMVILCLAVVAAVLLAIALPIYLLGRGSIAVMKVLRKGSKDGPPSNTLNDGAAIMIVMTSIGILSLEGIRPALNFNTRQTTVSSYVIRANSEKVWSTASVATSPDFPLPIALRSIPQPVKIMMDEGVGLGARRVVLFAGREGSGELSMRIAERTATEASFEVITDTSPISTWVAFRTLTFRIEPTTDGTRLTAELQYDRLLSPAWFFRPFMGLAAYLAVDTLARDIRQRAEAL